MFRELGFEVVTTFGFCCATAQHIAHIPDEAKERAITELLATPANRLDAVVQCGTGMSMLNVIERLEARTDVPIVAINPTTLWYALRENGFDHPLHGAGRLLREF
jgi:maleate isomerase